jgi:ABC-type transport system involved in cytochrome bd biosynthesis fused ATPase/permease subunit
VYLINLHIQPGTSIFEQLVATSIKACVTGEFKEGQRFPSVDRGYYNGKRGEPSSSQMIFESNMAKYGKHEASFSVPQGSAFSLIGANGAGKTTTVKILMNILQPSGGMQLCLGLTPRGFPRRSFSESATYQRTS